jgi:predicted enzyme related to lactoylglutathione lyase
LPASARSARCSANTSGFRPRNSAAEKGDFEEAMISLPQYAAIACAETAKRFAQSLERKSRMKSTIALAVLSLVLGNFALAPNSFQRKPNMSAPTEFALTKVAQISVRVTDIDRATEFYQTKLGLKHQHQAPSVSIFDCGGVTLLLSLPEKDNDGPASVIYFDVADMPQAFATLKTRGVEFVGEPHIVGKLGAAEVWVAIFRDSENNLMGLRSLAPNQ